LNLGFLRQCYTGQQYAQQAEKELFLHVFEI
jgi:hypothetical protein